MQLVIRDLSKRYANGVQALDKVSLAIEPGMFGLLGPNGAGKSTFMRTLATLQEADSGSAFLDDIDVLRDKDLAGQLRALLPLFDAVIATRYARNPRSVSPDEVAAAASGIDGRTALIEPDPAEALATARRRIPLSYCLLKPMKASSRGSASSTSSCKAAPCWRTSILPRPPAEWAKPSSVSLAESRSKTTCFWSCRPAIRAPIRFRSRRSAAWRFAAQKSNEPLWREHP